jgi:flavodoxin
MSESQICAPRIAIVVASIHHGNTQKVAQAMAEVLSAEIVCSADATLKMLSQYDVIGFGSGIYFGKHHASLTELVNGMENVPSQVFIFSTAGLPFLARLFHWPLRRALRRHGCRILGEFSCRGWDTVGPLVLICGINRHHPNDFDLKRAQQFAIDIRDDLSHETGQSELDKSVKELQFAPPR